MTVIHILGGLVLILLTAIGAIQPMVGDGDPETGAQRLTALGVFTGLVWAGVVFTGFFQIGSVNTLPRPVLYKLGYTVLGGILALIGFFAGAKRALAWPLFYLLEGGALVCFFLSLFWALAM